MKSNTQIVHGGGWHTRQTVGRPRARFFGFMSLIWLGVSLGVAGPFWATGSDSFSELPWLCLALLIPLPIFVGLALMFFLKEQPRTIIEERPNPDYDIRKLY